MKRKIIRQGNKDHGSFTVTLPSEWTKKYGLKAGDEVDVDETGNMVCLYAKRGPIVPKSVHIDARNFTITQLHRHIQEAYRSGAETIEVQYQDGTLYHPRTQRKANVKEEIEHMVPDELLGMEIEKSTSNLFVIKQFSEAIEDEFETALHKIFFKLQDQVDKSISALHSMKPEQLRSVWVYDRGVNKFCNFCMRILNKKGHKNVKTGNELYAALAQLENLGDMIYMIPMVLAKVGAKEVNPEIPFLLLDVKKAIGLAFQYFTTHCEEHYFEIIKLRDKFYEAEKKSFKRDGLYAALLAKIGFSYELIVNLKDVVIGQKY